MSADRRPREGETDERAAEKVEADATGVTGEPDEAVVEIPIDGALDLHAFRPADARDVVDDYLDACRDRGVLEVRIIHGKGKGVLRRIVHSLLERRPDVVSFGLASDSGSWGATVVHLANERPTAGQTPAEARTSAESETSVGAGTAAGAGEATLRAAIATVAVSLVLAALGCGTIDAGDDDAGATPTPAVEVLILPDGQAGAEVTSLTGASLFRPSLSEARRAELEENLAAAAEVYAANPGDEDALIWYGRRLAYLSRYNDAIEVYSRGVELHPDSYKVRRHRGHRYISTRRFDEAVADLTRAAELAQGQPVEIEPDGAPNALGIPLSNVHFNIWYHLGLAHYLRGDFEAARDAYIECMRYSDNDDLLVGTTDWLYMTYRRLDDRAEAAALLEGISADMEIIENDAYHRRLLMYKGEVAPEELLDLRAADDPDVALNIATQGYGVGNWYLVNGDIEAAREVFERILEGTSWAAFGYIAAEADVARGVEG